MSDACEGQPPGVEALCSLNDTTFVCKRCGVKLSKNDHFTISKHTGWVTHLNAAEPPRAEDEENSGGGGGGSAADRDDGTDGERDDRPSRVMNYNDYRRFFERNAGRDVPTDGLVYGPYVAMCYDETLKQIRCYVDGKKIWASFQEMYAPPVGGRPKQTVINVMIGTLEAGRPGRMFLLTLEEYRGRDFYRLCRLFNDAMRLLWPNGVRYNDVLLFLSDPLDHMLRAVKLLRTKYRRMMHVTGTSDVVEHRVVGRVERPLAESLILMDGLAIVDDGGCWPCVRDILNMTAGYETMRAISRVLKGGRTAVPVPVDELPEGLPKDFEADHLPLFEYAPVSLVDVKRSYPPYMDMLANVVPSYGLDVAKKTIVIQCNSSTLNDIRCVLSIFICFRCLNGGFHYFVPTGTG